MNGLKFLVTGGSGKLGSVLCSSLNCVAPKSSEMSILDAGQIESVVKKNKFDAILHLAAFTNQKLADKEKSKCYELNVIGTRNVAAVAKKHSLKVFYISTDYVFPCTSGNYSENDIPSPVNWYGCTKYAGEIEVQNATGNYCIIRTSFRPTKWEFPTAYSNVFTSADYVDVIANELKLCLDWNLSGVIHIGTAKKSLYELAKIRNPDVSPQVCTDVSFPKLRDLNITKWLNEKKSHVSSGVNF